MPVEMRMWRIDGHEPRSLTTAVLPAENDLNQFLARGRRPDAGLWLAGIDAFGIDSDGD